MNLNSLWNDEVMEPESKAYANAGPGSLLGMRGERLLSQKSQTENQRLQDKNNRDRSGKRYLASIARCLPARIRLAGRHCCLYCHSNFFFSRVSDSTCDAISMG